MPEDRLAAPDDVSESEFDLQSIRITDAVSALQRSGQPGIPIVDPVTNEIVAILARPDFLDRVAEERVAAIPIQPPRLGGMATPLGVYLTDGTRTAGPGFFGLYLNGVMLCLMGLIIFALVQFLVDPNLNALLSHNHSIWATKAGPLIAAGTDTFLPLLLLLAVFRASPIAGTHAAEHQVVHCIERGHRLTPYWVGQMPRVHPRCGTNLCVGSVIFFTVFDGVFSACQSRGLDVESGATLALVAAIPLTLVFWRRLGGLCQYYLTTRTASASQITGAIRSGENILAQINRTPPELRRRPNLLRRFWTMGFVQVGLGYFTLLGIAVLVLSHRWPELRGLLEI